MLPANLSNSHSVKLPEPISKLIFDIESSTITAFHRHIQTREALVIELLLNAKNDAELAELGDALIDYFKVLSATLKQQNLCHIGSEAN